MSTTPHDAAKNSFDADVEMYAFEDYIESVDNTTQPLNGGPSPTLRSEILFWLKKIGLYILGILELVVFCGIIFIFSYGLWKEISYLIYYEHIPKTLVEIKNAGRHVSRDEAKSPRQGDRIYWCLWRCLG
jgi:hypothetical protein